MLRAVFRLQARQVRLAADSWGFPGCLWREVSCPSSATGHGPGYFGSSSSDPGRAAPAPLSSWESGQGRGRYPLIMHQSRSQTPSRAQPVRPGWVPRRAGVQGCYGPHLWSLPAQDALEQGHLLLAERTLGGSPRA